MDRDRETEGPRQTERDKQRDRERFDCVCARTHFSAGGAGVLSPPGEGEAGACPCLSPGLRFQRQPSPHPLSRAGGWGTSGQDAWGEGAAAAGPRPASPAPPLPARGPHLAAASRTPIAASASAAPLPPAPAPSSLSPSHSTEHSGHSPWWLGFRGLSLHPRPPLHMPPAPGSANAVLWGFVQVVLGGGRRGFLVSPRPPPCLSPFPPQGAAV